VKARRHWPLLAFLGLLLGWLLGGDGVVDLASRLQGPSPSHLFGTDELGRDLLRRWWLGGARSLTLAGALTAFHVALGLGLALAAHRATLLRRIVLGLADLLASVPSTLLALLLLALLRPGLGSLVLALALGGWIPYARLALNRLDVLRADGSLLQVQLMGATALHRFLRHVLPRLAPLLLAQATVGLGAVILVEGGLSFLGVGLAPDLASWGTMLASGRAFLLVSPWTLLWPAAGILLALLAAGAWRGGAGLET
jgi:peptide/nickel transport system permease protein